MNYYGYLVVAGSLLFDDHRRRDTLGNYGGGAHCYSAQRIMVSPGIERNGSIERFWELKNLPANEIECPDSVDEVVAALESDARARQCHLVWPGKRRNIHDFGYAMRTARALVAALSRRERGRFTVVSPSSLNISHVVEYSHICTKYQKKEEKDAKNAEKDARKAEKDAMNAENDATEQ